MSFSFFFCVDIFFFFGMTLLQKDGQGARSASTEKIAILNGQARAEQSLQSKGGCFTVTERSGVSFTASTGMLYHGSFSPVPG